MKTPEQICAEYNEKHPDEQPFKAWLGGPSVPWDWDRREILRANGKTEEVIYFCDEWSPQNPHGFIVGYRPSRPSIDDGCVRVRARLLSEWESEYQVGDWAEGILRNLGLILPDPTPAQQCSTATGIPLEDVERITSWMEANGWRRS